MSENHINISLILIIFLCGPKPFLACWIVTTLVSHQTFVLKPQQKYEGM
jgi:hypothetical protein